MNSDVFNCPIYGFKMSLKCITTAATLAAGGNYNIIQIIFYLGTVSL